MRLLVASLLLAGLLPLLALAAPQFPTLSGRVVDRAGILDPDIESRLDARLAAHERATGNQIVVVTLPDLQGYAIEEYGYQLGREWGIGQKGKDNGALLIVAPNQRETRIEVGYGLEGELTDAQSSLIIQRLMLPRFRQGDYAGGIAQAVDAMIALLGGGEIPAELRHPPAQTSQGQSQGSFPLLPIVFFIFWFMMLFRRRGRRRGGMLLPGVILGSGLGGGFSRGSGGFGGGFSGGGGSFGGGGASGRW